MYALGIEMHEWDVNAALAQMIKVCLTSCLHMLRGQFLVQCHAQVMHRSRDGGILESKAASYSSLSFGASDC